MTPEPLETPLERYHRSVAEARAQYEQRMRGAVIKQRIMFALLIVAALAAMAPWELLA